MPNCGPEVELKRTHQVFDVGCACPPCKGNAPYPYATRPCLSTRVGEHQSGPQMAFTPPRRSLSPLPHSLSYLPRSLPWERERARHDLHCRRPELHAVVFSITPAPPPLSLTPCLLRRRATLLLTWAASRCRPHARYGRWCPAPWPSSWPLASAHPRAKQLPPPPSPRHAACAALLPRLSPITGAPAAGAVPLGAAGVRGQHVAGHHRASHGHRWVRMNPVVLPHLLAASDEPPSALNHELLRASSVNPDQGLRATIQEKTGAYLHSS
jgi:hypothetical protein